MNHLESLIISRIYEVINSLLESFPYLSAIDLYNLFDVERILKGRLNG